MLQSKLLKIFSDLRIVLLLLLYFIIWKSRFGQNTLEKTYFCLKFPVHQLGWVESLEIRAAGRDVRVPLALSTWSFQVAFPTVQPWLLYNMRASGQLNFLPAAQGSKRQNASIASLWKCRGFETLWDSWAENLSVSLIFSFIFITGNRHHSVPMTFSEFWRAGSDPC